MPSIAERGERVSTSTKSLLADLARSREYRSEFVAAHAKHVLPIQIQELLKQHGLTQTELAAQADLSQGTVSRAADLEYGNLTINTCVRVAAGFDVAFICGFVPFSRFIEWADKSAGIVDAPTFDEEFGDAAAQREVAAQARANVLQRASERFQYNAPSAQMRLAWTPPAEVVTGNFGSKVPNPPLDSDHQQSTTLPLELYGSLDADKQRQQTA